MSGSKEKSGNTGFGTYASVRIVAGIVIAMGCLWLFSSIISFFSGTPEEKSPYKHVVEQYPVLQKADGFIEGLATQGTRVSGDAALIPSPETTVNRGSNPGYVESDKMLGGQLLTETQDIPTSRPDLIAPAPVPAPRANTVPAVPKGMLRQVIGIAFVDALIQPMEYELEQRFWGWRPNDLRIFKFGMDNVENYQLGVREVTRRSVDILAERIARTGSNVSYNKELNDAVNSLTVSPTSYWWPSAEGEYKRAMANLRIYKDKLLTGQESFYTRADNLIPLLVEYRTRMGDCEDKLVRREGDKETQVSTFEADDRFYFSKGVAAAILPVLEAIQQDFSQSLKTRDGVEALQLAIESCRGATNMSPWIVMEGDYNGFVANHRANMATFISYTRFYLGVVIKTLST